MSYDRTSTQTNKNIKRDYYIIYKHRFLLLSRLPLIETESAFWDFMEILFEELRCEMFYTKVGSFYKIYLTVVGYYINIMKTTFDFNFNLYQALKQHLYTKSFSLIIYLLKIK